MLKQDTGKLLPGVTSRNLVKFFSKFSVFLGCIFFKTGVYTFLYIKRTIKRGGREKVERGRRGQKKEGGYTRSLAHAQVCK